MKIISQTIAIGFASTIIVACSEETQVKSPVETIPQVAETKKGVRAETTKVPPYEIIENTKLRQIKRSVVVRLNEKVSKDELKALAGHIKRLDAIQYDRTFIAYYLPDMEIGAGGWATTHYNPKLDVKILGLSKEAQDELENETIDPTRNVIGIWYDERAYVGAKLVFFKKNNETFVDTKYKDGSGSIEKLNTTTSANGSRFEEKTENDFGEYWLLKPNGTLRLFDKDGLIVKYKNGQ